VRLRRTGQELVALIDQCNSEGGRGRERRRERRRKRDREGEKKEGRDE
jgi:hypothetical protein